MGVVSPSKELCLQNHGNYLPKPELQKRACTLEESNQLQEKKTVNEDIQQAVDKV